MKKIKIMKGKEWIYDLDDGYLMLPEHCLNIDLIYTINETSLDANELIEDIENE